MKNLETKSSVKMLFFAVGVVGSVSASTDTSENEFYSQDELEAISYCYGETSEKSNLESYIDEAYKYVDFKVEYKATKVDDFLFLTQSLADIQVEMDKELVKSMDKLMRSDKYKNLTKKRF